MGENYTLSKSDDYEPKKVTPEKREAIIDALKHFNMIEWKQRPLFLEDWVVFHFIIMGKLRKHSLIY